MRASWSMSDEPGKERRTAKEFGEDAADRPHVDGRTVEFGAEKQLGGAVPARHHLPGVLAVRAAENAREAKVGDLDAASW